MVLDAEDYTENFSIVGSEIMVPIDMQGTTIMMPVDIQGQTVNVAIDIAAQSIGAIAIDIAAQSIAQLDINIAASTVELNIKTSGGTNIIIDKLLQGAYTGRDVDMFNDNEVTTPTAPPSNVTGTAYWGKFFPRGCRGQLNDLRIYCKRTASGTLTLSYSPQPGMGAVGSVVIMPGSDWDWKYTTINRFWNYDSLFVWVSACSADVSYGYDATAPTDALGSTDSGVTWSYSVYRFYIRAAMRVQTVGDLPISGTVNTVELPAVAAGQASGALIVPASDFAWAPTIVGAGELIIAIFYSYGDSDSPKLCPIIRIDGAAALPDETSLTSWRANYVTTTSPGIAIGVWDTTNNKYSLVVAIPLPFKRELKLGYYNMAASQMTGIIVASFKSMK